MKKFIAFFMTGVLFSTIIFVIILVAPVFQPNMPLEVTFFGDGNCKLPSLAKVNGHVNNAGPGWVTPINAETISLSSSFDNISSWGSTVNSFSGNISIVAYFGNDSVILPSAHISSVSLLDMINHNILFIGFEWNSTTQTWKLHIPVEFYQ
jgi:hypothetical protein